MKRLEKILKEKKYIKIPLKRIATNHLELKAKIKVSAHKFTATAKNAIEAAGGEVVIL